MVEKVKARSRQVKALDKEHPYWKIEGCGRNIFAVVLADERLCAWHLTKNRVLNNL